jgi:hypothetical protein
LTLYGKGFNLETHLTPNAMMYGYSSVGGLSFVGMHFHMLFVLLLLFGFVAGLVWMMRFANKEQVKQWFWMSVIAGALGMILTAPLVYSGMQSMMQGWSDSSYVKTDDDNYRGMMNWFNDESQKSTDSSTSTTPTTTTDQTTAQ